MGFNFFNYGQGDTETIYLQKAFWLSVNEKEFVETELVGLYQKILMDCLVRSKGLIDSNSYFDNCLSSESNKGIITLLAEAMYKQGDLYLVEQSGIVRLADKDEQDKIKEDYAKSGKSSLGIACSFKHFRKTNILKIYYIMLYNVFDTTNSQMNISKALKVKIKGLRDLIGLSSKDSTLPQGKELVDALKQGKGILLDKEDDIEATLASLDSVNTGIELVSQRIASTVGMPISYINGELSAGLSSSGEGDSDMVERGLKPYFSSIWKPVVDSLFASDVVFASDSWRALEPRLRNLPYIESSDLLSIEAKQAYGEAIEERI